MTPGGGFSPSVQMSMSPMTSMTTQSSMESVVSVVEMLLEQQRVMMKDQSEEMKEQRAEMEAKAKAEKDELRLEMQQQMVQLREAVAPVPPAEIVTEAELASLQERIVRLHAAKLWKDDEMFAMEDTVSDFIEIKAQVGAVTQEIAQANPVAGAVKHLVALSSGMPNDAAFARQARRKFL